MKFSKKHWWKILISPFVLLLIIAGISQFAPSKPPKDFLVTHNFLDLSQIDSFTKYRSCAGHQTIPQYNDEPVSNMQHYVTRIQSIEPDQLKIYAPFDGYVTNILSDEGVTMVPAASRFPWWPFNQWRFAMPHTNPLPQFDSPSARVQAGDLIGYADLGGDEGQKNRGTQVRVGVTAIPPMFKNGNGEPYKKLDSVFNYMSDEVFAEYQSAVPGLKSREDLIISKEWREAHACKFIGTGPQFDWDAHPPEEHTIYLPAHSQEDQSQPASPANSLPKSYSCPDGIEYGQYTQTVVIKNGVKRKVGADEQNWVEKNCNL